MEKLFIELKAILSTQMRIAEESKKKLKDALEKQTMNYALNWNAESAMVADEFLNMTDHFKVILEKNKPELDEVKSFMENVKRIAYEYLTSGRFEPNSTSAMSNLIAIAKGKACGKVINMVEQMESAIERHGEPVA